MTRIARRLAGFLILACILVVPASHATAPGAVACSCAQPQPLANIARDPDAVSFVGVAGREEAAGVPVQVSRWFRGFGMAQVVWLDPGNLQGGNDGGLCGTEPLQPGTEWVIVGWRMERHVLVDMCSPHALTDDAQGRQMLRDLTAAFGPGAPVVVTPPPEAPSTIATLMPMVTALVAIAAGMIALSAAILALFAIRDRRRNAS